MKNRVWPHVDEKQPSSHFPIQSCSQKQQFRSFPLAERIKKCQCIYQAKKSSSGRQVSEQRQQLCIDTLTLDILKPSRLMQTTHSRANQRVRLHKTGQPACWIWTVVSSFEAQLFCSLSDSKKEILEVLLRRDHKVEIVFFSSDNGHGSNAPLI